MNKKTKIMLTLCSTIFGVSSLTGCTSDDISELRSQISQLQSELSSVKEEITTLQNKMESDIEGVKSDYNSKINALQEEITALQTELNDLDEELTKAKKELGDRLDSDISELQEYIDGEIAKLTTRITSDEEKLASLKEKHDSDIESARSDYESKISALSDDVAAREKEIEDDYNYKISSLETDFNTRMTELQKDEDANEAAIEELRSQHASDVSSIQSDYDAKLANLSSELESGKQSLQDDYNAKISNLNTTYETRCSALQSDIDSCNSSISNFKAQYETDKKALEDDYNAKINALQEAYEEKVKTIEDNIASINNQISSLKNEMNSLIEDIQEDYNEKISSLSDRVGSLETKDQYTAYFYLDGSLIGEQKVDEGKRVSVPSSDLTKGYSISQWYTYDSGLKCPWSFSGCVLTSDVYLYADFEYQTYSVTFEDTKFGFSDRWGSATYRNSYNFSSIYSQGGYTLTGWKDQDGNDFPLYGTYNLTSSVTLTAQWSLNQYNITYSLDGGENPKGAITNYSVESETITLPTPTREGYRFDGWSNGVKIVTTIPAGSYGNVYLTATWSEYHALSVTSGDESKGTAEIITTGDRFCSGDQITVKAAAAAGYKFGSWLSGTTSVSTEDEYTFTMPDGDYTLVATWESPKTFAVSSGDETLGTASITSGDSSCFTGDEVTVSATPSSGCEFKGWYNGGKLVSASNPYTFEMPSTNYSLVAEFYSQTEVEERKKALGITPTFDNDSNTVTYGLYPQTHVSDETTVAALNALTTKEANGWYLLDGTYYAKKSYVNSCYGSSDAYYSDGEKIVQGGEDWFRCEPIKWNILESANGTYSLVSSMLLDVHDYNFVWDGTKDGIYANNYEKSEIREWLNGTFYDTAFGLDSSLIQEAVVDNSASTTDSSTNDYVCDNTTDKVYLLSYQDYSNASYFADNASRCCKVTDWAKANCGYYDTSTSDKGNGCYWTRSPDFFNSNYASLVHYCGPLSYDLVGGYRSEVIGVVPSYFCVRPAVQIKVS